MAYLASTRSDGEYFAYLGWPMLVVLLLAAVCFWRDLRVRALAVTFVVLEFFSLGSRTVVVGGLHIPATGCPGTTSRGCRC